MARGQVDDSVSQLDLEEQLFDGVVHGSLDYYEAQLGELKEVDVRGWRQRTLLHVAAKLGKVDWVERLLRMGADPSLKDCDGLNALDVAEQTSTRHPQDTNRQMVLKLVRLAREIKGDASTRSGRTSCDPPSGVTSPLTDVITGLKEEVAKVMESSLELKEEVGELRNWLTSRDKAFECLELRVDFLVDGIRTLGQSVDVMKEELSQAGENVLKVGGKVIGVENEMLELTKKFELSNLSNGKCIDSLMRKTAILNNDIEKVTRVLSLYMRLQSTNPLTTYLLDFLQSQRRVKFVIDCDSYTIEGMRTRFRDHDGVERDGRSCRSHADFDAMTVYVGGKEGDVSEGDELLGRFAMSLAEMCVYLAFENGGRPYYKGDKTSEEKYKAIVAGRESIPPRTQITVDGKIVAVSVDRDFYVFNAVSSKRTQLAKEIHLISAVPGIIAFYGSEEVLRRKDTSLLDFYESNVMATLVQKSKLVRDWTGSEQT